MKIEMMLIGALLFSVIFVIGLNYVAEGLSEYNVESEVETTFGKMSNNLKDIYDYQDSMKEDIQGGTVTDGDAVDNMIKGGYTSIKDVPFSALTVAGNATMTLAQETGYVHPALIMFFITVMGILVLFAILALIFRFRSN